LKFIYDITDSQFRRYIRESKRVDLNPHYALLRILERRLDTVVFRLGFGKTRPQARQMVNHGNVLVNEKKVDIASYQVKPADTISLRQHLFSAQFVQDNINNKPDTDIPQWLERKDNSAVLIRLPEDDELRKDVNVSAIFELYS
jgi:small subunit ribosomal protein S4